MAIWASDIDSMVYTVLKYKLEKKFKAKYPNIYITNSRKTPSSPKFPTVYYETLESPENGQTFERDSVEGILYTVQITVTALEEQTATELSEEILPIMKGKQFSVLVLPKKNDIGNTFGRVSRFRRQISSDDNL